MSRLRLTEREFPGRLELVRTDRLERLLPEALPLSALADSSLVAGPAFLEPMAKAATATRAHNT